MLASQGTLAQRTGESHIWSLKPWHQSSLPTLLEGPVGTTSSFVVPLGSKEKRVGRSCEVGVGAVRWESELWVLGSFCVHTSIGRAASNACGCVRAHMCPEVQSWPISSQRSPEWCSGKGASLPRPQSQQMVGKGIKRDSPPPSTASSTNCTVH